MTVLGFDNITYGYILHQCVSESVLGGLVSASAIVGISGSIAFPFLRKSIGLVKTGIVGFVSLIACLTLCVASIFLLGSPFDPNYIPHSVTDIRSISNLNLTTALVSSNLTMNQTIKEENDLENCITPSYLSVGVLLAGMKSNIYFQGICKEIGTRLLKLKHVISKLFVAHFQYILIRMILNSFCACIYLCICI